MQGVRVYRRLDAHVGRFAQQLAIPLVHGVQPGVGVFLHARVIPQHIALEPDPSDALAGLAVGYAPHVLAELGADRAEHRLGIGKGN